MNNDPFNLSRVRELLIRAVTNPKEVAAELRVMAARLNDAAAKLELQAADGYREEGGIGDKVTINVVGPDNNIKQTAETRR